MTNRTCPDIASLPAQWKKKSSLEAFFIKTLEKKQLFI